MIYGKMIYVIKGRSDFVFSEIVCYRIGDVVRNKGDSFIDFF